MSINNKNTYQLNNLNCCAFMLTCQEQEVELLRVEEDKFHNFSFILSNPDKCEELKRQYLNNASAPALELFSKREMLIGEIKTKRNPSSKGDKTHE